MTASQLAEKNQNTQCGKSFTFFKIFKVASKCQGKVCTKHPDSAFLCFKYSDNAWHRLSARPCPDKIRSSWMFRNIQNQFNL